ncbi:hypothetical protein AAG906_027929 [Vitis piasezkii]
MGGLLQRKRRYSSSSSVVLLPLFWAFFLAIFLERSVDIVSGLEYSKDKQAIGSTRDAKSEENERRGSEGDKHTSSRKNEERVVISGRGAWQVWHQNRTRCPKGTVPIRRTTVDDVLRPNLYDFGKKQPRMALARHTVSPDDVNAKGHEYAIATSRPSKAVYGAVATINVWNPSLQVEEEMSISQIWVLAGSFKGSDLNSVEAGWHVLPDLHGDKSTRLFAYWTADGYQSTGCYNTLCPGFVQVDKNIVVGAAMTPVSTISGKQSEVNFFVWKDPKTGNWWWDTEQHCGGILAIKLFTHLAANATQWNGVGGVQFQAQRRPHFHPNGLRPLRPRGQWESQLFPKPGTRRFK